MSFKRLLCAILATAILLINCVPALAEEELQASEAQPEVVEAPREEPPKSEPVKEEAPKEESVKEEAPKAEPVKEEAPKEEPVKEEAPKAEPVREEAPKEEPVKEEAPKEEPVKQETPQEAPAQEEPPKQEPEPEKEPEPQQVADPTDVPETPAPESAATAEPVTPTDPTAVADPTAEADPTVSADPTAVVDPTSVVDPTAEADPTAVADPTATVDPTAEADPTATTEPTEGAETEQTPEVTEEVTPAPTATPAPTPVPAPPEITSLSASKGTVLVGESASFSFSGRSVMRYMYRVIDPSGSVSGSGTLSSDADHYSFEVKREGRYTFELTALGGTGEQVSASASVTSIDAPALTLSVRADAPSCHGGDPVNFTLSVTQGLELSKVSIKATLGGKKFYETDTFTEQLTVTPPAKGRVSEVSVTASVTDIYGRTVEKSATIPCAVHDPESRAHWEATMKGVKKTGVWPDDLIAIARTQIGYKESSKDFGPKYDGGISGYTRYGDWAGMPYEEWCAMFACFCLHYAGIEEQDFPYASNCQRWINALKKVNLYAPRTEYTPKVGDLAFFDWQNDNDSDHVGIIFELVYDEEEELKGVKTIEGNSKGAAVYDGKYYSINDGTMIGYGLVNRAYDREVEKHHRDLTAETEGFTVEVGIEPEAKVPARAELNVAEIVPGDAAYDALLGDMRAALTDGDLGYARFMKIGFTDEDGEAVEVQAPLTLTVTFNEKMVGDKGFTAGVAAMAGTVTLNPEVTLTRNKRSCAFSFTQNVGDVLCLYASGDVPGKAGTLTAKQGKTSISVDCTDEALVPDGAALEVYEIEPDTEGYSARRAAMRDAWPEEGATVRFFEIRLTFNGMPVTPAVPVSVQLDASQKGEAADIVRVEDGMDLVTTVEPHKGGKIGVGFNADRFGTFAVIYR